MGEIDKSNWFPTVTYMKLTPDGNIYVQILERDNKPVQVIISAGKTGSQFAAYCESIARLTTKLLEYAGPWEAINTILAELSNITTDRAIHSPNGIACRSGAEGVYLALLDYRRDKQAEEDDATTIKYRPPTLRYGNV